MNIGYAVRFCRQQKRINLPTLAARTQLSASYLSLLERGKREPSLDALKAICRELQIPVSILVFLGSDPGDMVGLTDEVREKLASAVLNLLKVTIDDGSRQTAV